MCVCVVCMGGPCDTLGMVALYQKTMVFLLCNSCSKLNASNWVRERSRPKLTFPSHVNVILSNTSSNRTEQ